MTVINMMSFGDSGAAIADEQQSWGLLRKSNIADKLHIITKNIAGGSGHVYMLSGVSDIVVEECKPDYEVHQLASLYALSATRFITQFKENALRTQHGLSFTEMLQGKKEGVPLDEESKKRALQTVQEIQNELNQSVIVLGGIKADRFRIYLVPLGHGSPVKIDDPYASIGSGSDEAHKVLTRYVEQKPRKERKEINRVEGILKLIEATNAASTGNIGVGGVPQIMYADAKGVREIDEEKCVFASEVVKGLTYGQLPHNFVRQAISSIVFDDPATSFEDMHDQMKKKAKSWEKLDRMLRGYKV